MADPELPEARAALSPFRTGPLGRCPRCGKSSIFAGYLALRSSCEACGLDLTKADTGDGPSFFASFIGSIIVIGLGVVLQVAYEPPVWVYVLLIIAGGLFIVGLIRPLKGLLTALQYTSKAAEGRIER